MRARRNEEGERGELRWRVFASRREQKRKEKKEEDRSSRVTYIHTRLPIPLHRIQRVSTKYKPNPEKKKSNHVLPPQSMHKLSAINCSVGEEMAMPSCELRRGTAASRQRQSQQQQRQQAVMSKSKVRRSSMLPTPSHGW